jgi:hypothetical protein
MNCSDAPPRNILAPKSASMPGKSVYYVLKEPTMTNKMSEQMSLKKRKEELVRESKLRGRRKDRCRYFTTGSIFGVTDNNFHFFKLWYCFLMPKRESESSA